MSLPVEKVMARAVVSILVFAATAATTAPVAAAVEFAATFSGGPQEVPGTVTFATRKSVAALQKCLTDKLSDVGEVVALDIEKDSMTLVVRDNPNGTMVLDLAPASVTVTTRMIPGTRQLVESCAG